MRRHRLAVIATHPIQYYAPLFRLLTERAELTCHVFYGWVGGSAGAAADPGFGRAIQWDIPLLSGYEFTFVPNDSKDPGTHHWGGISSSQLLPLLRSWSPDAVLVYGWNYRSHLTLMRALHGHIPILFRGDSNMLDERVGPRMLLRRAVLRYVYRHVDVGLYVGARNREYFRRHGLSETQLCWVPHSVDNDRFDDVSGCHQRAAREWRRSLGIADNQTAVLFAGKLEPKKAPDLLLEAFLARASDNDHLVIVGSGVLEAALRELAGGHPRVHFLGFQNQSVMPVVYRLGDLFVLPSRGPGETWGLAINEAMAAGRPTVVSDRVGCAPDLVSGERNGFIFPSDNVIALADCLTPLLRDSELRHRFASAAKQRIACWSFAAQAKAIEGVVAAVGGT